MNDTRSLYLAEKRYMRLYGMTPRQAEIYARANRGWTINSIANECAITRGAVMAHLRRARVKKMEMV